MMYTAEFAASSAYASTTPSQSVRGGTVRKASDGGARGNAADDAAWAVARPGGGGGLEDSAYYDVPIVRGGTPLSKTMEQSVWGAGGGETKRGASAGAEKASVHQEVKIDDNRKSGAPTTSQKSKVLTKEEQDQKVSDEEVVRLWAEEDRRKAHPEHEDVQGGKIEIGRA